MNKENPTPLVDALRASRLFGDMETAALRDLASAWTCETLPADAYLLTRHEHSSAVYLVVAGKLDVYVEDDVGRRTAFRTATVGALLGELSAIDLKPRSADVVTREPCCVARMDAEPFRSLLLQHPHVLYRLLQSTVAEVRSLTDRLAEMALLSCGQRLRNLLLRDVQQLPSGDAVIPRRESQSAMAEQIGVRREAINRQLQLWLRSGVLEMTADHYRIVDAEGWRQIVDQGSC